MSEQLKYEECYHKVAHESVITVMALSPNGRRLITGSDDSTLLVWSTQSGQTRCRIKAHSPILSLAWLTNSTGFLFGCENGMLASVNISERSVRTTYFKGHSTAISCVSPHFNDVFPMSAGMDDVKIWRRTVHTGEPVESWELKAKVASPSMLDRHRNVEVISVNWEDRDAAVHASRVVVAYRWHGIICWDVTKMTILWRLPMEECGTFSLSLDGRSAVTYGPSSYFEVRDLKSGTVRRMGRAPTLHRANNPPVCFAHGGFAVAGVTSDNKIRVWDAEHGDELLCLDHGEGSKVHTLVTAFLEEEDKFLMISGTQRQGKNFIFLWVTVPCGFTTYNTAGQRIELSVTRGLWINVSLIVAVLSVLYAVTIKAAA